MNTPALIATVHRLRLSAQGRVQGVGFRPTVLRVAQSLGLSGWVLNSGSGVDIEVQGLRVDEFAAELARNLPPNARLDQLSVEPQDALPDAGDTGFRILESAAPGQAVSIRAQGLIPADLALCNDCLQELFAPQDRRYRYPFIACCNCGPRLSMVRSLPYDRARTSMADFPLCADCMVEYKTPADRRFHAEPIACAACGPGYSHPVAAMAAVLRAGGILALKGVGGYQLLCDARNTAAVRRLRARKQRATKPFALLLANLQSAGAVLALNAAGREALISQARPIVIAPAIAPATAPATKGVEALDRSVLAPGMDSLGVQLPSLPVHYLLLHALLGEPQGTHWLTEAHELALVCTSANDSGQPMLIDNAEALASLGSLADLVVTHDRDITDRVDDSVLRQIDDRCLMIRRARGYVPAPVTLRAQPRTPAANVLAFGAQLKNTAAVGSEGLASLSQHLGDLTHPATIALQRQVVTTLRERSGGHFDALACDWHPDFQSTRAAQQLAAELAVPLLRIQHHHAHIAAVQAEHQLEGPVLGVALDGYGYGLDGAAWGGELLLAWDGCFQRHGRFANLALPGGDRAAREPWRLAAAWLAQQGETEQARCRFAAEPLLEPLLVLCAQADLPQTSSAGRWFDCAASLLGIAGRSGHDSEAAMRLESVVQELPPAVAAGDFAIDGGVLSFHGVLAALAQSGDPAAGAARFHAAMLAGLAEWIEATAATTGVRQVVLGGGCFANRLLANELPRRLRQRGLVPFAAAQLPTGDGGLSLGQAWIAQRLLAAGQQENQGEDLCVSHCR